MTSFRSRYRVVSTELFPPVVIVPSAKTQFSSLGVKNLSSHENVVEVIFMCSIEYLEELLGGRGGLVLTRREVARLVQSTKRVTSV